MAKRKSDRVVSGMAEVVYIPPEKVTADDLCKRNERIQWEVAATQSLDWLRQLQDDLKPLYGPGGRKCEPSNDPVEYCQREVYLLTERLLSGETDEQPNPEIVRLSFLLGAKAMQAQLQSWFDPMIKSARRVKQANTDNARKKAALKTGEWKRVADFITKRPAGVSLREICKQASTKLQRGEFKGISRVVDYGVTPSALEKRWRKTGR